MVTIPQDTITLWSNDPVRVRWAARHGVDRIGLDLETIGKQARQRGLPTWISPHRLEDLTAIRPELGHAALFVRCNALHSGSREEIERLSEAGTAVLMLPNFTTPQEVEQVLRFVDARLLVVPLVERKAALSCLPALSSLGIKELHVGLNDLSIDLGHSNRLVVLASREIEAFADEAHSLGLRFGLGGLGRALDVDLPVPSELVYAQHARLGSSGALLARSFFGKGMEERDFAREISNLRARLAFWRSQSSELLEQSRHQLAEFAGVST